MIEKIEAALCRRLSRLLAQPPGINHVAYYPLLVTSVGVEPTLTEPKSVVRPSHREALP